PPSFPARDSGQIPAVRDPGDWGPAPSDLGSAQPHALQEYPSAPFPKAPSAVQEAVVAPSTTEPVPPSGDGRDLSSTDELEDPDGDAAADAGIEVAGEMAATRRTGESPFEGTRLIAEPEADAIADDADNPFAFTQVHVDVDDD
ncbi:MAG: hypothetical protein RIF41_22685, partial [Polyangiaceae bacterium]